MKYIEDMKDGDNLTSHYYCKEKRNMRSRAGKSYISLLLSDRTGTIDGKIWDMTNNIQPFEAGDFIKVEGSVANYQGELQLKIVRLRKSVEGEYILSDYLAVSACDTETMYDELTAIINTVSGPVHELLTRIFLTNNEIASRFKSATAAKTYHHNYMGGLLEHTLSVTRMCDYMSTHYRNVNRDVLIAAGMLHDIGKIWELAGYPENDYTDVGQLLGHIYIGTELIERETAKIPDFPSNLALLLKHCVLAHHGDFEFGSPRLPSILEAFILYNCDNMDAKVYSFQETIEKDKSTGKWAGYNKMLARNIRRTE